MSGFGSYTELIYANTNVGIAKNTFTTEIGINDVATMGPQVFLPAGWWQPSPTSEGRGIRICARGIISTFTSGTFTISVRLGGIASITGPIVLGSAAMTMTASQT